MQESNHLKEKQGKICEEKSKDCIRIITQNTHEIGKHEGNKKELTLKEFINNTEADILGIHQTNICWHQVSHKDQICDIFFSGRTYES